MRIGRRYILAKSESGQSLVEVLVVAALLGLMLTAIMSVVVISVNNNRKIKVRSVATRLAQGGADWVRSSRDSLSWFEFDVMGGADADYCIGDLSLGWGGYGNSACAPVGGLDDFSVGTNDYTRQITFTFLGNDAFGDSRYSLDVSVSWIESGSTETITVSTNIVRKPK